MKNDSRQFFVFDLEIAAKKDGASVPTMDEVVVVFEKMKIAQKTHEIRDGTASLLIGDIGIDAPNSLVTLLIRLSDKTTPNSAYSDPSAGHFTEHKKVGNVGADFGCHVIISTEPEVGFANIYTCAIERVQGLTFGFVQRLLSKLMNFEFHENASFFVYPHPAGGIGKDGKPKKDRCCPHIELRGRPSDTFVNDVNTGRITGVSLIRSEQVTPIAGAPYLTKTESKLKLNIDHQNLPANLWASLKKALKLQSGNYGTAQISYRVPNSSRSVTVDVGTSDGSPLNNLYIQFFEVGQLFPFLAQSSPTIVPHLRDKAIPEFVKHRSI